MYRRPLVMGNWKLNGSQQMVAKLITELRTTLTGIQNCSVAIAPPMVYLAQARAQLVDGGDNISLAAQNVDVNLKGAFTGEIAVSMLKEIGVKYVIIGHSERRTYHHENAEIVAKKFAVLKSEGLIPVLCIGESQAENEARQTETVCKRQLNTVLETLGVKAFKNAVIAYEPVWAIGTGLSATPQQAQKTHKFIRDYIAQQDAQVAEKIIIQYGGSVNANNAAELFKQPDIDGALVGGASLEADKFIDIVKAAENAQQSQ